MAKQNKREPKDRRIEEMPKGAARPVEGPSDEELLEQAADDIREAGDLYGSDMARDDRKIREARANQTNPNEQH